jgi:hypothetical protein
LNDGVRSSSYTVSEIEKDGTNCTVVALMSGGSIKNSDKILKIL